MALVVKTTLGFNTDYTKLVLTDTTGAYNSVTNTTGYGTPNAGSLHVAKVYFQNLKDNAFIEPDVYDVANDTIFYGDVLADGFYKSYFFQCYSWTAQNVSLVEGQVFYNTNTELYYVCTMDVDISNMDVHYSYWENIGAFVEATFDDFWNAYNDGLGTDATKVYASILIQSRVSDLRIAYSQGLLALTTKKYPVTLKDNLIQLKQMIEMIEFHDDFDLYVEGLKVIANAEFVVDNINHKILL